MQRRAFHYKLLADGWRQIQLCRLGPEQLTEIVCHVPQLVQALGRLSLQEELMLAEQVIRIGRRTVYECLKHFLIELLS